MVLDAVTTLFRVVICFAAAATASGISGDSGYVLRWASAGGGWRSMISNIGYANSFAQSGIIDPNRGTCNFTAISSNSGGSWFTMQFFYSQPFFDNVVSTDKTAVYVFIIDWLQSYGNFLEDLPRTLPCLAVSPFGLIPDLEEASSFCDIVMSYDGSWGGFIEGMLRKVAEGYGDPELPDRLANANNRVSALRDTDCFVQTSLAADSRYARSKGGILLRSSDDVNYVSPSDSDRVLAVSLGAQYAVKGNRTFFQYALPDSDLPLMTHWARGPRKFRYDDWDDFHLYPSTDNRDIFASKLPSTSGSGLLADPFKGNPNVAQIAAASSAALSLLSPAVPSFFAQYSSLRQYDKNAGLTSKDFNLTAINALFNIQLTRDLAVCTQWPSKCGSADGRFLDGGFTDGPSK